GFGIRSTTLASFSAGLPVGLSQFCTNAVSVDYSIDDTSGAHTAGTLIFPAGLTRRFIPVPLGATGVVSVTLLNPSNAEITGSSQVFFQNLTAPPPQPTVV